MTTTRADIDRLLASLCGVAAHEGDEAARKCSIFVGDRLEEMIAKAAPAAPAAELPAGLVAIIEIQRAVADALALVPAVVGPRDGGLLLRGGRRLRRGGLQDLVQARLVLQGGHQRVGVEDVGFGLGDADLLWAVQGAEALLGDPEGGEVLRHRLVAAPGRGSAGSQEQVLNVVELGERPQDGAVVVRLAALRGVLRGRRVTATALKAAL